ncbi:MAG: tetratricopeptide repeat protein [Candidatus Obscuribacterales bacterium]|nr:tetratricopeptide repeat protein [Candidatus Obscuribacterales bacterium]
MSAAVFSHNLSEINWKLWTIACLASASAAAYSAFAKVEPGTEIVANLSSQGQKEEEKGHYLSARQDYNLALLHARASGNKDLLLKALLNSARLDSAVSDEKTAALLADEALELATQKYGINELPLLDALLLSANSTKNSKIAVRKYKSALAILKKKSSSDLRIAEILLEMSCCYQEEGREAAALSCCNAALRFLEERKETKSPGYAKAIIQYSSIADVENEESRSLLKQALQIQEKSLGPEHPELALTLCLLAAGETGYEQKTDMLKRALKIDQEAFGFNSIQVAFDLAALADIESSARHFKAARELREKARIIYQLKSNSNEDLSSEVLDSYAELLHQLKFEKDAERIRRLVEKRDSTESPKVAIPDPKRDTESDPEYWQRSELLPIISLKNFRSNYFDNIQVSYKKGELILEAFNEGEIVWTKNFAQAPTGIVNIKAEADSIILSQRDGDGPIWHEDIYRIGNHKIDLLQSRSTDAYAQQMEEQIDGILSGDPEAIELGSVEAVPATYINNNFLADAIRKGERKALQLYGEGDPAAAAERLRMIFELSKRAINSKREYRNPGITQEESWLDAFKFQGLPLADYVSALNDYGFFLQQSGNLKESSEALLLVVKASPQRAVAHLNLADSLWQMGKRSQAIKSYQLYLALKISSQEDKDVPSRVWQRISIVSPGKISASKSTLIKAFGV